MPQDWVIMANSISADVLRPDLNIFIDIAPEVSFERVSKNRDKIELYESVENLTQVRNKYFEAFGKLKNEEKVFIIDGNRSVEEIFADVWKEVKQLL